MGSKQVTEDRFASILAAIFVVCLGSRDDELGGQTAGGLKIRHLAKGPLRSRRAPDRGVFRAMGHSG